MHCFNVDTKSKWLKTSYMMTKYGNDFCSFSFNIFQNEKGFYGQNAKASLMRNQRNDLDTFKEKNMLPVSQRQTRSLA